jgi:hypothetical protein
MGLISDIFKTLFSKKKRKKHRSHAGVHIGDEDEWSDENGDNWDSGDYGSDDGGDGGD